MERTLTESTHSPLLTEKQTSRYLLRSLSALRRDRAAGSGPEFARIGRSIRYRKSDLDAYILRSMAAASAEMPNE
jgi:hypothetical protein